jgi:UDPglucose--hexose-1-phosphate uridylyltransferase
MNQLRLNPLSGEWVAVSTGRSARGAPFRPRLRAADSEEGQPCRFCLSDDIQDDLPIAVYHAQSGPGKVTSFLNRYPAFVGEQPFIVEHRGPVFIEAPASGQHEVLILSPDHNASWATLPDEDVDLVMRAIAERVEAHLQIPGLRYSQAIVNYGRQAGASVEHPHAQLLGIPFVPRGLVDEQAGFARFAGGCLLCTAEAAEERAGYRLVHASDHAVTFAPFWSGTPYELLVVPRIHGACFHKAEETDRFGVGRDIREALRALTAQLGDLAYNIVFHSAPYNSHGIYHWHVHILPKLATRAGFELGTGVPINVVAPEASAEELRAALGRLATEPARSASA